MLAVIMAGGEGSRLRPLTCTLPKPMVPLANRPVMQHILGLCKRHGFNEAVATLFTMPQSIKDCFGTGTRIGIPLRYSVEEKPLGTAGSVKLATRGTNQTFLVISGDVLTDFDLTRLVEFHRQRGSVATLALTQVDNPLEFGVVLTDDDGRVKGFLEKPDWGEVFSDLVNTGIYVLEPEVLDLVPDGKPFDFSKDLFPTLLKNGCPVYALHLKGYWCDIGTVDQYRQANADCLTGKIRVELAADEVKPQVWVEEGAFIHPTAILHGPTLIGRDARIDAGAVIGPGTIIGQGSKVGVDASVKQTIIWDNCTIGKRASVNGSVISSDSTVGYRAVLQRGSVLGQQCDVGQHSTVWGSVKLWPKKRIEDKAIATSSVVWSDRSPRTLFGRHGVSGLANVEVGPELCSRIAAAFSTGAQKVIVSAALDGVSQMLSAATVAGAQSAGAEVLLAGNTLPPVLRYAARRLGLSAIRIQTPPTRPGMVDCTYFDKQGLHISRDAQRKIEAALAREDFPKAPADQVKPTSRLADYAPHYIDELLSHTGVAAPLKEPPKVLIEAGPAEARLMSALLDRLNVESVFCGEGLQFNPAELLATGCSFGISVFPEGESISVLLADDGYVPTERMTALLSSAWALLSAEHTLALPVSTPVAVRRFAESRGARVVVVKSTPRAVLEREPFSFLYDGFAATALLLGMLDVRSRPLAEVVRETPEVHFVRKTVLCPWEHKGRVMRRLAAEPEAKTVVEGIEAEHDDGRVLVLPHAEEAVYELFAEASSWEIADELSDVYAEKIRSMITR